MNDQAFTQNRELSWLAFNDRVLTEATDETVPLLERPGRISLVAVEAGRSSALPVSARPAFRNTPAAGRCSPSICCLRQWGRAVAARC